MNISLTVIGRTQKGPLATLISDYEKRLKHYINFELQVIPDPKNAKKLDVNQLKVAEGQLLLSSISDSDFVVLLDEKGKTFTSRQFSQRLQKHMNAGRKRVVYVIGGAYGFSDQVYERANGKLALSAMTFSHQMVRLIAIEQLYRAFTILNGEPYHHD
jgi:23S rRNA (pseudouridine1915-N3)-methyltransferase